MVQKASLDLFNSSEQEYPQKIGSAARAWKNKYTNSRAHKEHSQQECVTYIQDQFSLRGAMATVADGRRSRMWLQLPAICSLW
jgi:hypothetical protein